MLKLSIMSASNILKKLNSRDTRLFPKINTITKIIFTILIVFTVSVLVKNVLAADNIIKQTQDAQIESNNAESWNLNSWNTTAVNALTTMTGQIPFDSEGNVDAAQYQVSGLLGTSVNAIASLYTPQASGVQYIAEIKDNLLGKSAYAQGGTSFGTDNNLKALLPMWKVLRNVVYAIFAVIFVFIGIMIMLRVKISPQAVITIQNSIPKLITSLILVTFSYAIAGLIIDISNWIQALVLALIFNGKGANLSGSLFNKFAWQTVIPTDLADPLPEHYYNFQNLANADFTKLSMLANRTVPLGSLLLLGGVIVKIVLGTILGGLGGLAGSSASLGANVVGQVIGYGIGVVGGIIFMIILFILVSIWLIKLFFGLLKTYVTILIKIITGPLEIGIGAFPNSKIGFSSWIMDLVSKVAVFPIVLIALVFINYLVEISTGDLWVPNILKTTIGTGRMVLGAAIGIAGLALISKLPDLVPEAIFKIKPSAFGKAIGEGIKPIEKTATLAARGTSEYAADKVRQYNQPGATTPGWAKAANYAVKAAEKAGLIKDK